jgi:anti-anti-sigma factor
MSDPLTIRQTVSGDHLVLLLAGRLDAYWSAILAEQLERIIHDGQYEIQLDTEGITYISSAGIRVLLNYFKKLKEIQGSLAVIHPSDQMRSVLGMSGLNMLLAGHEVRPVPAGSPFSGEIVRDEVRINFETVNPGTYLKGIQVGSPSSLTTRQADTDLFQRIPFHRNLFGIGIGAFGDHPDEFPGRAGEFIGMGDAIACLPTDGRKKPDYLIRYGQLIPEVNLLYGLLFEGSFSHRIHFESQRSEGVPFSKLVDYFRESVPFDLAGLLMIAETTGLVGVSLSTSPLTGKLANPVFSFPEIREMMAYTTEPDYNRMLTLTTGIAAKDPAMALAPFLRPFSGESSLQGHFHSAVFSFHPLKKQLDDPHEVILTLIEQHQFETILHLIRDKRPHTGIGESSFRNGICWIGKIDAIEQYKSSVRL